MKKFGPRLLALTSLVGGLLVAPVGVIGPTFAQDMLCATGVWAGSNFQVNNRCGEPVWVMFISDSGQCSDWCQKYFDPEDYYMYTAYGNVTWFACPAYKTPVALSRNAYRCD